MEEWNKLIGDLEVLSIIRISIYCLKEAVACQLHGFCNASTWAYAAVVYLRCFYQNGIVELNLMTSKTCVAPIKGQTIPCFKLFGVVILACFNTLNTLCTLKVASQGQIHFFGWFLPVLLLPLLYQQHLFP